MKKIYFTIAAVILGIFVGFTAFGRPNFDLSALAAEIPGGEQNYNFISPKIRTTEFNAWFVKFKITGAGEPNLLLRLGDDARASFVKVELTCEEELCSAYVVSQPVKSYQFKLDLQGSSGFRVYDFEVETKKFDARETWSLLPQATATTVKPDVISRGEWGADPKYLLKKEDVPEDGGKQTGEAWNTRKNGCQELQDKYPEEFKTDGRKVAKDAQGRELQWPYTYSKTIKKIVIHSTATDGGKDTDGDSKITQTDMEAQLRAIYYYHAQWMGWGDIGYNYIIDQFGNIYEGRSGGDKVIGAHAYCANIGTVGIAFLGDYRNQLPTTEALVAGENLLADLAAKYDLDLTAESAWHGKKTRNLVGHRDYVATECPGNTIYNYLPELAAAAMGTGSVRGCDYDVVDVKWPPNPFSQGSTGEAWVQLKNKCNFTWKASGSERTYLGTSKPQNSVSPFLPQGGSELGTLIADTPPGGTGMFKMQLTAPARGGRYYINFAPAIKGKGYLPDYGMNFHVTVREPRFSYFVVDKSKDSEFNFGPGQKKSLMIQIKNSSQLDWEPANFVWEVMQNNGLKVENLELKNKIKRGEKARFDFSVTAPIVAGKYRLVLRPAWRSDETKTADPIEFLIEVGTPELKGDLVEKPNAEIILEKGESKKVRFTYKNTGNVTWRRENIVLQRLPAQDSSLADSSWISPIHPAKLLEAEVAPGQLGHFEFTIRKNTNAKRIVESFTPIVRGLGRIRGPALEVRVQGSGFRVQGPVSSEAEGSGSRNDQLIMTNDQLKDPTPTPPTNTTLNSELPTPNSQLEPRTYNLQPTIRIKLSFESSYIEIGGGPLKLVNASNTPYKYSEKEWFGVDKFADNSFVRLAPDGDTVLEILNWKHTPGWSDTVNDNKYRGILEVRRQGKQLIVINELPLEDYLRGIAEPVNTDPNEKVKLLAVLARSYALFYTDPAHRKYPGQPYDGSDNPAEFQKYLGYNYELRGAMPAAVEATQGLVVTHNGSVVKTPYFTSSGGRTKTASEVGWDPTFFQFTKSVPDPWSCGGNSSSTSLSCPANARGHGVGVSAKGAEGLAKEGKTYREILDYFFSEVEIEKAY